MPDRPGPVRPGRLARLARTIRLTAGLVAALGLADVAGALTVGRGHATAASGPAMSGSTTTASAPTGAALPGAAPPAGNAASASAPPGTTLVTGTVTTVHAGGATGPALTLPLEINVPVRGRGSATFYNVSSGGQPTTVVWQGEEPLDLEGHGSIVPRGVDVTIDANGSTWSLDGAQRVLTPGTYTAAAPVAVGRAGLAQPEDSATFLAGATSVLATDGGATVQRTSMALHLVGPGSLDLAGNLVVVQGHISRHAGAVHLTRGSYVLDIGPQPGGLGVSAVIGGPVSVS